MDAMMYSDSAAMDGHQRPTDSLLDGQTQHHQHRPPDAILDQADPRLWHSNSGGTKSDQHSSTWSSMSVINQQPSSTDHMSRRSLESTFPSYSSTNSDSNVIIKKLLDKIESLESELEHVKMERDSLIAENERLCFQLQMANEADKQQQQQQRRGSKVSSESPITVANTQSRASCTCCGSLTATSLVPSEHIQTNGCVATIATQHPSIQTFGSFESTTLASSHSSVCLTNGQEMSLSCTTNEPNDPTLSTLSSKSLSTYSFRTVVPNDMATEATGNEALSSQPVPDSASQLGANVSCQSAVISSSQSLPAQSSSQTRSRAILVRSSAISTESYMQSPIGQTKTDLPFSSSTLSPTMSRNSINLTASLNLSPTSATAPLFGSSHPLASSNLVRAVRATGGSSTSLASTANSASYMYEISQQLLDKQVSVLERKYGGREAREAAIKIQRAFRSYRLQKRFTCLAIQAISHQQLKQQQHQLEQQRQLSVHSGQADAEANNENPSKKVEKVDSSNVHNQLSTSRRLSTTNAPKLSSSSSTPTTTATNFALEDKSMSPFSYPHSHHHPHPQMEALSPSGHYLYQQPQHQYLHKHQSQSSVKLVTSYEPMYHRNATYVYNSTHSDTEKVLQKKTSFSSTSSTASSSSLHASSASSKPSEGTSMSGKTSKDHLHERLHPQQLQHQISKQRVHKHPSSQSSMSNLSKASVMANYSNSASNMNPANTVSFAPSVEYVNSLASSTPTESVVATAANVLDIYRKRQFRVGLNLFNKTPSERGIRFLITNGFIEHCDSLEEQAKQVAHFLLSRKGVSRLMIGEYIAENSSFNQAVLKAFASEINLQGIIVDEALRSFQTYFRFPGEAQKIERLVEAFADRYKECNPSDVLSRDSIFILAFAIIMLNTDLHKPTNIKHRMTPEQWLANLKGVFSEGDLASQFLLGIYKRIKKQELQTGPDHVTQVVRVQSTIVGKDVPNLSLPHRRLVCYCRLYEIRDLNRREKVGQHQRDVFLFNDMLLITKTTNRSRSGQLAEYQYRLSTPLDGLNVLMFSSVYYPYGIRICRRVDDKSIACFNARNDLDQKRFVDDIRESIAEMDEMEQLRITKSSSLVQLNSFSAASSNATTITTTNNANGVDGVIHQQPSSSAVNSNTSDVTNSLSSMSSMTTLPSASTSTNGCVNQHSSSVVQCVYPSK